MNPTDPMKNPKAFNKVTKNVNTDEVKYSDTYSDKPSSMEKGSHEVVKNNSRRHLHRRRRGSKGSFTSEFGSEKGDMDHFVVKKVPQSDHKRSVSKGVSSNIGSFSSTSHSRHNKSGSHSFNEHRVIFFLYKLISMHATEKTNPSNWVGRKTLSYLDGIVRF